MEMLLKEKISEEFYRKEANSLLNRDENKKMKFVYIASSMFFLSVGYKFTTMEPLIDIRDICIPEIDKPIRPVNNTTPTVKPPKVVDDVKPTKSSLKENLSNAPKSSGGGQRDARVTSTSVLSVLSGKIKNMSIANADPFGKNGFASDLDALLAGTSGLKSGETGGIGRKGIPGIGNGPGNSSGFGGPGVNMGGLLSGMGTAKTVKMSKKASIVALAPTSIDGVAEGSGRSKEAIRTVVMKRIGGLKYLYNKYLKTNPQLAGKITIKMVISPGGTVIRATVLESSLNLKELEQDIVKNIKRWNFGKVPKGDATVVYPFNFSS